MTPIAPVGATVTGIDLSTADLSDSLIDQIRSDIHNHQLLIFKNQSPDNGHVIPPLKRIELARKLGTIVSSHYHHPNAPHRDIFRVSNDEQKGCLNVGRTGWHIDGTFLENPYRYSMMHIVSVPKAGYGQTAFISSASAVDQVLDSQKELKEIKDLFHRLFMVGTSPNYALHRMIYKHPVTNRNTMLIHLGMTSTFLEINKKYQDLGIEEILKLHEKSNKNGQVLKVYDQLETKEVLGKIEDFIQICKRKGLMYKHEYEAGDLLISDNLAVIHEAVPSTQFKPEQIGLRIMDRISIGE